MADPAGNPFEDECTLDDLWAYLRLTVGLSGNKARAVMLAAFRGADLPVRSRGNGNDSIMDPGYWEHLHLKLGDQGRLVVQPLHFALDLDAGEYRYTTSWRAVRMLWPRPEEQAPATPEPQPVEQAPATPESQPPAVPAVAEQSSATGDAKPKQADPQTKLPAATQSPEEYFVALCQANPKKRGEPKARWAKRLHPLMMTAFDSGLIIGKRWSESTTLRSLFPRK
jgi:hypothetical protein